MAVALSACSSASAPTSTTVLGVTTTTTIPTSTTALSSPFFDGEIAVIDVGGETLSVAVADTSQERAQGLMGAETLAGIDGMLFIHDGVGNVSYTMRDTLIELDIWFIGEDGRIIGTAEMEPCTTADCPSYESPGPVTRVLETPIGLFDFAIGDIVSG